MLSEFKDSCTDILEGVFLQRKKSQDINEKWNLKITSLFLNQFFEVFLTNREY